MPPAPAALPAAPAEPVDREEKNQRHKPKPRVRKHSRPEPIPAPPGTPLFDCYSGEKVDHFMTTDRASAGQVETSKAKYRCSVVGYVYQYPAPNTTAIEVNAGTAYVFTEKDSRTQPACDKVALYRHETGYDYWYSSDPSDTGFAGYMKP